MAKKSLLLVDADPKSLRVLEVSLRKAGYSVTTCGDGAQALEMVDLTQPDLILSDTRLPGELNGFELVEALRASETPNPIPFMFLASDTSVESKVRGLELGVEDYLTKPIYIKEILTRINLTLQRQEREGLRRTSISKTRFTGSLGDMGLVDLLQTIEVSRKSGVLELFHNEHQGTITFRDGQLIDAELGSLRSENAIYRLLLWNEGDFEVDFRRVDAEAAIVGSTQAILMEGMRRVDEWGRLLEQLPSLDNVFEISEDELMDRLAEIPDEINDILRHFDGRRSLQQVVDASIGDELEILTAITKLYFEGIIFSVGPVSPESLEENVLVGATLSSAPPPNRDSLVPRSPTLPPPRANPDGLGKTGTHTVSPRVDGIAPDPPGAVPVSPEPTSGTKAAHSFAGSSEPQSDEQEIAGLSDDPSEEPLAQPREEENGMTEKKGRRRRKRKLQEQKGTSRTEASSIAPDAEAVSSNVIHFRPHAKVAAGGGTVSETVADSGETDEVASDATDDVRMRSGIPPAGQSAGDEAPASSTRPNKKEMGLDGYASALLGIGESTIPPLSPDSNPSIRLGDLNISPRTSVHAVARTEKQSEPPPARTSMRSAPPSEPVSSEPVSSEPVSSEPSQSRAPARSEPSARSVQPAPPENAMRPPARPSGEPPFSRAPSAPPEGLRPEPSRPLPRVSTPDPEPISEPEKPVVTAPPPMSVSAAPELQKAEAAQARAESETPTDPDPIGDEKADGFFDSDLPPEKESWDDLQKSALPMSPAMKRAKFATFGILAVGVVGVGGFMLYQALFGVPEAELSHTPPPELPSAAAAATEESTASTAPAAEEPAAQEPSAPTATNENTADEAPAEAEEPTVDDAVAEPAAVATAMSAEDQARYDALIAQASRHRSGRTARAITAYEEALTINPQGVEALTALSFILMNSRQNDRAAELAQRASNLDSTNARAWLVLGYARHQLGDDTGARSAYQSCIDQGTDDSMVRECRSLLRAL